MLICQNKTCVKIGGITYALKGGQRDIEEVFKKQPYKPLMVYGKVVHDIGSSVGDTALYFLSRGAFQVIGYELDKERHRLACINKDYNEMIGFFPRNTEIKNFEQLELKENSVVKIDIEGAEYHLMETATKENTKLIEQMILEFHYGSERIENKLRELGFEVKITHRSLLSTNFGIMLATRKKEG
jgi:hypothetical protein